MAPLFALVKRTVIAADAAPTLESAPPCATQRDFACRRRRRRVRQVARLGAALVNGTTVPLRPLDAAPT